MIKERYNIIFLDGQTPSSKVSLEKELIVYLPEHDLVQKLLPFLDILQGILVKMTPHSVQLITGIVSSSYMLLLTC